MKGTLMVSNSGSMNILRKIKKSYSSFVDILEFIDSGSECFDTNCKIHNR